MGHSPGGGPLLSIRASLDLDQLDSHESSDGAVKLTHPPILYTDGDRAITIYTVQGSRPGRWEPAGLAETKPIDWMGWTIYSCPEMSRTEFRGEGGYIDRGAPYIYYLVGPAIYSAI